MLKLLLFFHLTVMTLVCSGSEYAVIAHQGSPHFTPQQIQAIFLKKLTLMHHHEIVALNLNPRNPLRTKFEQHLLKMNFSRLRAYWSKQHYLGHRPPISLKSQESVKAFVQHVDGAIGYVDFNKVDESVSIIYRWSD